MPQTKWPNVGKFKVDLKVVDVSSMMSIALWCDLLISIIAPSSYIKQERAWSDKSKEDADELYYYILQAQ